MMHDDTIYALSSGGLPSGVAVIRLSGSRSQFALTVLGVEIPEPRLAKLRTIRNQNDLVIDTALVLFFPAPFSFTGEDCVEIHLHGGRAVVQSCFQALSLIDGLRLAEAGEFTKRAFDNGKMDLTEAEGLADLISSETEMQRKLAIQQADGRLKRLYDDWSARILRSRALIEAELDFSDEEDIPGSVSDQVWKDVELIRNEILDHVKGARIGEIQRSGYSVVIAGAPNAGKSSLLNALSGRDVAIVSDEKGTTRDILEVRLDLDGNLVILKDTAGLRDTQNLVEKEGIRRARLALENADLVLYLVSPDDIDADEDAIRAINPDNLWIIGSKSDIDDVKWSIRTDYVIDVKSTTGLDNLLAALKATLKTIDVVDDIAVPTRRRHVELLQNSAKQLDFTLEYTDQPIEIKSEYLRLAQDMLGKITGRVDVEDLLGVIFSEFCVGK
jgi:tRNA modification GTPase